MKKKLTSVVLIVPYFGEFPNYIDLFLKSCELNSTIDWLIVTDNATIEGPKNVRFLQMPFETLINQLNKKLNVDARLEAPYKLCDYKPSYGVVFEDYIKDYDFWGHCDLDMIFGDIRKFLTEDIFGSYNKILTHGHLSLYRNVCEVNKYFMLEAPGMLSFKDAIREKETMYFDEIGLINILEYYNIKKFNKKIYIDILPNRSDFTTKGHTKEIENLHFYWENGKIFKGWRENEQTNLMEYLYIHFQKRNFKKHNVDSSTTNKFYITTQGFVKGDTQNVSKYYKNDYKHLSRYYYNRFRNISLIKVRRKLFLNYSFLREETASLFNLKDEN